MLSSMKSSLFGLFCVTIVFSQIYLKKEGTKKKNNSLNVLENVGYGSELRNFRVHYAASSSFQQTNQIWHCGKGVEGTHCHLSHHPKDVKMFYGKGLPQQRSTAAKVYNSKGLPQQKLPSAHLFPQLPKQQKKKLPKG